ncbi:Peroxisome chaperone and import receptor [Spiromyces aspiralis]|uniref:Peroxisome chaperone and import receptor n=1 Tax=Spiromyces aspiralis TaxID=68401 RepID=A0ACC1HSL1_9FUNG|nr:Peroxisome chaperone and import receptor [Spiromyces aspiralis]
MEGFAEEGQVDNMFEEMLDMFMSKNMLYDPMKELNQEYPKYLAANKDKLSKDEYRRYENQYRCVQEILAHFDQTPSGSDEDSSKSDKQVKKLMEKMQSYGQPPEDLIKILAPDLELGPDGVPKFPDLDQCNQM